MYLRILAVSLFFVAAVSGAEPTKKSTSGICHDQSSPSYARVKNFQAYADINACIASGGRLPKNRSLPAAPVPDLGEDSDYKRSAFGSWLDEDHDCMNTRHEMLMSLSVSPVQLNSSQCSVGQGKWVDPYTNKTFTNSRDLDIDHLVPLKWAWEHGAKAWTEEKRKQIANDPANLFAVEASANREKGAKSPLEWLPENVGFRCQYLLRFQRIVKKYGLQLNANETRNYSSLQSQVCRQAQN